MTVYAEILFRTFFIISVIIVLFFSLSIMLKKAHGKAVLAQLINTVNGDRIDITSWESAIGRAKTCDIVLTYSAVSRFHAVLARRNKGWMIFDTNSKTGIQVNGKLVKKQAYVYDGDILTVGNVVMCFRSPLFKRKRKEGDPVELRREDSGFASVRTEKSPPVYPNPEVEVLSALQSVEDESIILLFTGEYVIGRAANCDILLPALTVSRHHARLVKNGRVWAVMDMDSRAGTRVNGRKISSSRNLSDGDTLNIGGMEYRFIESYMRE